MDTTTSPPPGIATHLPDLRRTPIDAIAPAAETDTALARVLHRAARRDGSHPGTFNSAI